MNRRWLLAVLLPVATFAGPADGRAQAPDAPAEVRKAAEQLVDTFELESLQGETWVKAKRIDRALLYYSDPTRGDDCGFLWAWGDKTIIDGIMVNGTARLIGAFAGFARRMQTGYIYTYAFSMILGVAAFLTFFLFYVRKL